MKRRSFSLMLARRYLNPRRSMLSSFSLISLVGVMLGVLVLVVVMAVYAGMERDFKKRYLGFTPHVLLRQQTGGMLMPTMDDWHAVAGKAGKLPHVESAAPFVGGPVIMIGDHFKANGIFRGLDTTDPGQVAGIESMLARDAYPESSADMGLDDRVVVSSLLAENCGIQVGDTIRLVSGANTEQAFDAFQETDLPLLREGHKEAWEGAVAALESGWKQEGNKWAVPIQTLEEKVYNPLSALCGEKIRQREREMLEALLVSMEKKEFDEAAGVVRFAEEEKKSVEQAVDAIRTADRERMDTDVIKSLKKIILPREAVVVGVYQATMMVITPDVFLPLPMAQDLAGTDDRPQGLALRLDDPYQAEAVAIGARAALGGEVAVTTWGEQFKAIFSVISQQRVMLYFVLSFIALVSAFSMMAVMFTVTIQKRREIGVMKALGAAPGQIVRVFLYQGMLLGVLGAALGVGLGRVVIHFRGELQGVMRAMGFDPFSMVTGSPLLPAHNDPLEQAVIAVMGFVLCSLAAFVPAFFAARSDAAKSLRNL